MYKRDFALGAKFDYTGFVKRVALRAANDFVDGSVDGETISIKIVLSLRQIQCVRANSCAVF